MLILIGLPKQCWFLKIHLSKIVSVKAHLRISTLLLLPLMLFNIQLSLYSHLIGSWSICSQVRMYFQVPFIFSHTNKKWTRVSCSLQKQQMALLSSPKIWSLSFVASLFWQVNQRVKCAFGLVGLLKTNFSKELQIDALWDHGKLSLY